MTTQMQQMLADPAQASAMDQWFIDVMGKGDFDGLDEFLTEEMRAHPHKVTSLCLLRPPEAVRITGWSELAADFVQGESAKPDAPPFTAVGIDLSDHTSTEDDRWWLEVSFYDDTQFNFSDATIDEINAQANGSTPWQGCFREIGNALVAEGLGRIHEAMEANQKASMDPPEAGIASMDAVAQRLGQYFVTMRFHQALQRDLAEEGLPRPMIVLGGAHDVAPFYEAAYGCDTVRDCAEEVATILKSRDGVNRQKYNRETENSVQQWRDRRNAIVRKQLRADKLQSWIDYCEASDELTYKMAGIGNGRPVHKLNDAEFEKLLYDYRVWRAVRIGDEPNDIPRPAAPTGGLLRWFRKAG